MKWIKVKEKLPEKTGLYLCVITFDREGLGLPEDSEFVLEPPQDYLICEFFNENDNYFHHRYFGYKVTHWMPLEPLPDASFPCYA